MELWVAQGDCGDYYCDGEHLLGVFTSKPFADLIVEEWIAGKNTRDGGSFEIEIDAVKRNQNVDGYEDGSLNYYE